MTEVTSQNFKEEVESSTVLTVIDLWAPWCGPCRMLAPIMEELEGEMPNVKFCKINVDSEPELARQFGVQSIPMIALVKDNTFIDMSVGYVPKDKMKKFISEHI